jgi:DUF1680 family protein
MKDGYAYFSGESTLTLDFHMEPRFVVANAAVHENAGKTALMYGPVVYCIEGVDNEGDIFGYSVDVKAAISGTYDPYFGLPVFTTEGYVKIDDGSLYRNANAVTYEKKPLRFIPYYGMENRGETDMLVWIPMK